MMHRNFKLRRLHFAVAVLFTLVLCVAVSASADSDIKLTKKSTPAAAALVTPAHAAQPIPVASPATVHPAQPPAVVSSTTPVTGGVMTATDPVPVDDANFYVREAALQREKSLLTLQSSIADLKKKIADATDGGSSNIPSPSVIVAPPASMTPQKGIPGAPPLGGVSTVSIPTTSNEVPAVAILRLASIISVGSDFQAVIFDHGVETSVREGSTLTDGWHVQKIAPSTVVLVRGHSRKILHVEGD